jgi:hypothetical protein
MGLQLKEYTQIAPRCKISGDPQQKTISAFAGPISKMVCLLIFPATHFVLGLTLIERAFADP